MDKLRDNPVTRETGEPGVETPSMTECRTNAPAPTDRNRRWREENKDALHAYAREIELEGLALARFRTF